MVRWLKKLFGVAGVAAAATAPVSAEPTDPFAIYLDAVRDLLGDDPEVIDLMILARDDPQTYERSQTGPDHRFFSATAFVTDQHR